MRDAGQAVRIAKPDANSIDNTFMNILKDLPDGTIWPHLLEAIDKAAVAEVREYAGSRLKNVARNAETRVFAAILVDKYGAGLAKAMDIAGIETSVQAVTDELVLSIDPNFKSNRNARWAARPADLSICPQSFP